ncbi:hypothetical protein F5Y16DRAFT_398635 [Xylariaceae sp. FL0255]|nr:hypothetical protein F5Y16DRAFT_398635 [Xylariaceae sp. FL0255]
MAPNSPNTSDCKKPFDISNLMSPPEPPRFDSFGQDIMTKSCKPSMSDVRKVSGPVPPLSPPDSPAARADDRIVNLTTGASDPILYPTNSITTPHSQQPLFARDDSIDARRIVDDHVSARPAELFKDAPPPKKDDYELALYFQSQLMKQYMANPRSWLIREREQLIADRRAQARNKQQFKLKPILPAKPQPIRKEVQRPKIVKAPKVTKPISAKPRPIRAGPSPSGLVKSMVRAPSVTPDPSPRRATAPNRVDVEYNALPDYCPPRDSLPNKANSLKVDWKGTPTDLSDDPDRHLLHPDEVMLASNLRLSCATYLTSKRRIFIRRLECLRVGKEFRRTDAQQACKIDVNKASKLWAAFEKVGWLEKTWIQQYL